MCAALGLDTNVDAALLGAIRHHAQQERKFTKKYNIFKLHSFKLSHILEDYNPDEDYHLSCLLMVFIAVSLPKLARIDVSFYKATLAG